MSEILEDSTDSFSYSMKEYDNSIVEGTSLKMLNQKSSITTNSLSSGIKVENLSHAILIQSNELDVLIKALLETEDYDERLKILEEKKDPFLFSSSCLIKILNAITSVKTKLAIVASLGPRLIDPKEKSTEMIDIFRFAEEKEKVQEILKSRLNTLSSSYFTNMDTSSALSPRLSEKSTNTASHLLSPRVSLLARPSKGSRPVSLDHTNSVRLSTSSSSAPATSSLVTNNTGNIKPVIPTNSSTLKVSVVTPSSTPPPPERAVSSSSSNLTTINPSTADRPRSNKTPPLPEPLKVIPATSSTSNNNNNNNKDIKTMRSDSNVSVTAATANESRTGSNAKQSVVPLSSSSSASSLLSSSSSSETSTSDIISTTAQNYHVTAPTIVVSRSSIAKTHPSTTIPSTVTTAPVSKLAISTATITNTAAQSVTSSSSASSSSSSKKNKAALAAENLALLNTKIATAFSEVSPRQSSSSSISSSTATAAFLPTTHTVKSTATSSPRLLSSSAVVVNNGNSNCSRNGTATSTTHQKDSHIVSVDDGTAALTLSYKPASIKSNNTSVLSLLTGKNK